MKILFISNDEDTKQTLSECSVTDNNKVMTLDRNNDPVEIVSTIYKFNPSIIVFDDDFLRPNSAKIIQTTKEIVEDAAVVFITGNDTIKLGREISQLGIEYYAIKPFSKAEMEESFNSLINHQLKKQKSNPN